MFGLIRKKKIVKMLEEMEVELKEEVNAGAKNVDKHMDGKIHGVIAKYTAIVHFGREK